MNTVEVMSDQLMESYLLSTGNTYLTRAQMMERLVSHGWNVTEHRDQNGTKLMIKGPWNGDCYVYVPDRHADDHAFAMQDLYNVVGYAFSELMGISGNA